MANSIRRRKPRNHQSAKPHPDFPLTAHPSNRWCKKVRGKIHFFGKIDGPEGREALAQAALDKWLAEKDEVLAGRVPGAVVGVTLRDLVNRYLTYKQHLVDTGELSKRTWAEYHATCERLVTMFGRDRDATDFKAEDFERLRAEIARQWGPTRLGNEIQRVRSIFKFGYDNDLIEKPIKFGTAFKRPSLKTMRKQRAEKGPRMFQAKEIKSMLKAADGQLRAMVLLGINAGFGNEDVATLKIGAIDLSGGWVQHPRPKTGVERKCKLWPETIRALRKVLADRKAPHDPAYAERVFITKYGQPWANGSYGTALTHEMDKLLRRLKLKRPGASFYTLRHTHRTVADGSRDQKACDYIMGHVDSSMAGHYIERIEDGRLEAVAAHVHAWLFKE